ncbi:MAG: DRTGG domain-containing protein [Pseudomonadota bacterium]
MNVRDMQSALQLQVAAGEGGLDREVAGGYAGDLLSDVMANAHAGSAWITVQGHQNIIAVAVLRELSAIILANGRMPDEDTRARADKENIPVLLSSLSSYQLAGLIYERGIGIQG